MNPWVGAREKMIQNESALNLRIWIEDKSVLGQENGVEVENVLIQNQETYQEAKKGAREVKARVDPNLLIIRKLEGASHDREAEKDTTKDIAIDEKNKVALDMTTDEETEKGKMIVLTEENVKKKEIESEKKITTRIETDTGKKTEKWKIKKRSVHG